MNETVNSAKVDALAIASGYGDAAALARLKQAAEAGNARAQTNLGGIYSAGWGVTKDAVQALHWYHKAAEQGYANAQRNLGNLYAKGLGVPKDYTQAAIWFRKAAEQENADAQYGLGILYARGWGVLRNRVIADALWNIAAHSLFEVEYDISTIEEKMTLAEIAAAQALASEMAKPGNFTKALNNYLAKGDAP